MPLPISLVKIRSQNPIILDFSQSEWKVNQIYRWNCDSKAKTLEAERAKLLDANQTQLGTCLKTGNRQVVIVGGAGQLGQLFVKHFKFTSNNLILLPYFILIVFIQLYKFHWHSLHVRWAALFI